MCKKTNNNMNSGKEGHLKLISFNNSCEMFENATGNLTGNATGNVMGNAHSQQHTVTHSQTCLDRLKNHKFSFYRYPHPHTEMEIKRSPHIFTHDFMALVRKSSNCFCFVVC